MPVEQFANGQRQFISAQFPEAITQVPNELDLVGIEPPAADGDGRRGGGVTGQIFSHEDYPSGRGCTCPAFSFLLYKRFINSQTKLAVWRWFVQHYLSLKYDCSISQWVEEALRSFHALFVANTLRLR